MARPRAKSANVESTPPWTVPRWLACRSSALSPSVRPSSPSRTWIGPMCSRNGPWLGNGTKPSGTSMAAHSTSKGMIGVTGATGGVGSRVARRLAGEPLRLIVRDAARAPAVGAEVREASSYGARDEMRAALEGVDTLFLIPAKESADRLQQHFTAVDAAVDAGVKRIVYLSFIRRGDSSFTLGREHFATEDHIRESGLAWIFPRMNLYMDFIPNMIGSGGVIRGPADDGRFAAVLRAYTAVRLGGDPVFPCRSRRNHVRPDRP